MKKLCLVTMGLLCSVCPGWTAPKVEVTPAAIQIIAQKATITIDTLLPDKFTVIADGMPLEFSGLEKISSLVFSGGYSQQSNRSRQETQIVNGQEVQVLTAKRGTCYLQSVHSKQQIRVSAAELVLKTLNPKPAAKVDQDNPQPNTIPLPLIDLMRRARVNDAIRK